MVRKEDYEMITVDGISYPIGSTEIHGAHFYRVYMKDEAGKFVQVYAVTKAELELKVREKQAQIQDAISLQISDETLLENLCHYYFKSLIAQKVKPLKIKTQMQIAKVVLYPSELNKDVQLLNSDEINDFLKKQSAMYSVSSVENLYQIITGVLEFALSHKKPTINPDTIILPTANEFSIGDSVGYIFNPHQFELFRKACREQRATNLKYGAPFMFLAETGIPLSYTFKLMQKDIDFDARTVALCKRVDKNVWYHYELTDEAFKLLSDMGITRETVNTEDYIFSIRRFDSVGRCLTRFLQQNGLPDKITRESLFNSFIVYQVLENKLTFKETKEKYNLRFATVVKDIIALYEIQQSELE